MLFLPATSPTIYYVFARTLTLSLTISTPSLISSEQRRPTLMDTSSPAVFVNSELLKMYMGRRVRAVVQVMRNEGGVIVGQSTDGSQVTVKGSQRGFPLSHYVEVIGIADGNQSIRAEICTDFGEKFDTVAYNALCQLANVADALLEWQQRMHEHIIKSI